MATGLFLIEAMSLELNRCTKAAFILFLVKAGSFICHFCQEYHAIRHMVNHIVRHPQVVPYPAFKSFVLLQSNLVDSI